MELFITLTKGMGEPTGLVVWRLSRGKYIILCESSRSAGFKWDVLLLVMGYLT